jgi:uncharacterized protein with NRDE domain
MCIIAFAVNEHPDYPLILIGNRDEFYNRPTQEAHWWDSGILAGKDLEAGGTWLGINRSGRFAAVTNYRDIAAVKSQTKSRGALPVDFLESSADASQYLEKVDQESDLYNGFNLIAWEAGVMQHYSNYEHKINRIDKGVHVLSNALLDTKWPKTNLLQERFSTLISKDFTNEDLLEILQDEQKAPDEELPKTGLDRWMEKAVSSICIRTPEYGTCCSSILLVNRQKELTFIEHNYPVGDRKEAHNTFNFQIN